MAEIEMDIDTSAGLPVDGQADDDLIDYDDELAGQDEATAAKLGDIDVSDSVAVADAGHDVSTPVSGAAGGSYDQHITKVEDATNNTDMAPGIFAGESTDEQAGYEPSQDHPVDLEHEPQNNVPNQSPEAQTKAEDDIHDIDFGYDGEHEAEYAQPEKPNTWGGSDEEFENHQDHDQESDQEGGTYGEDNDVEPGHGTEPSATNVSSQDDEHARANDQPSVEAHPDPFGEDEITWDEEDKVEEQPEATQASQDQDANQDATAQDGAELVEAGTDHVSSPADQESFDGGEAEYPAITVQYKGDEFPLFSHSSEGFFTELSVLDDSIEALLAGFRSELVNEIASEEELVFQVDELGLEYAESYPRDSLSHVTLRQILEIFDLLVKNQDPDCSRMLYTFLFTKPSTSKRFESLVESAAAGKGLDEVMHLFESPMPQGTDLAEAAEAADSYHEFDEYESAGDASVEDTTENAAVDEMPVYTDSHGNPIDHYGEVDAEIEGSEAEYEQEVDENLDQGDAGQTDAKLETGQPANSETNATTENQSESILAAEVDSPAEDSDFDIDEGFTNGHQPQPDTSETPHARTSTTNTVNNDELAPEASGGAVPDVVEDQFNEANGHPEADDLAEIDWREEPGEENQLSASPSATKRARPDDELDMAGEKDVKRQRS